MIIMERPVTQDLGQVDIMKSIREFPVKLSLTIILSGVVLSYLGAEPLSGSPLSISLQAGGGFLVGLGLLPVLLGVL